MGIFSQIMPHAQVVMKKNTARGMQVNDGTAKCTNFSVFLFYARTESIKQFCFYIHL
jgi:hypothetical protein